MHFEIEIDEALVKAKVQEAASAAIRDMLDSYHSATRQEIQRLAREAVATWLATQGREAVRIAVAEAMPEAVVRMARETAAKSARKAVAAQVKAMMEEG